MSSPSSEGPLACPRCARRFPLTERFCSACDMPLVYSVSGADRPITRSHEKARKIDPRYAQGELVRVAWAGNQAEAEMIQSLLLEEGIPSMTKRTTGFDVPDFLAAGPRDIFVNQSGFELARGLLSETGEGELLPDPSVRPQSSGPSPIRLAIGMLLVGGTMTALYYLRFILT